jgi:hypothetical protein
LRWLAAEKKTPHFQNKSFRNKLKRFGSQRCQMVYFQTKNTNLGKFWKVLQWKMFGIFRAIMSTLQPNGLFYGDLVHFVVIWYILWSFGIYFYPFWCVAPIKIWQPCWEQD